MYVTLSTYSCPVGSLDRYRVLRTESIDTALSEQEGFISSTLMRSMETGDETVRLCHANLWSHRGAAEVWATADRHHQLSPMTQEFMLTLSAEGLYIAEEASLMSSGPRRFARISRQRTTASMRPDYLRFRATTIKSALKDAPGFVEAWTMRHSDEEEEFVVLLQWVSEEASEAFVESARHRDEFAPVLQRYLVQPAHTGNWEVLGVARAPNAAWPQVR